ncbi:MAG TPA: heparinase II/III-family protein, partial [Pyrinomonadaceae bacterium]|nr:heparinase II/III-family protein [Pyrinomonadaceae bacterium]
LNCGHAHADALSFDLAAGGRTILVDPGTYTYTGSKKFRDWFRSSFAHNTLTLDDCPSSWPGGTFSWKSKANCSLGKWISNDRFDFVSGEHDGYGLAHRYSSATLERSILFLKRDYWIMRDDVIALENHRASLLFHFDSSAKPVVDGGVRDAESGFTIKCFGDGHWLEEDTWVSHCYGQKENAKTCIFSAVLRDGKDIFSFLLPGKAEIEWRVTEIPAQGGNAFTVSGANTMDLVMIRCDERVETLGYVSDSEWLWIRFSNGKVQDIVSLPEKASDSFSTDELGKLYLKLTLSETL